MHGFQISGIDPRPFAALFELADADLAQLHARRVIADSQSGFPCRVSLVDAEPGDELLLLPFQHQAASSPYRASGPIFVRRGVERVTLADGQLPAVVNGRLMSLRAYDAHDAIVAADVCAGESLHEPIQRFLERADVCYLHLHFARYGCFAARLDRSGGPHREQGSRV